MTARESTREPNKISSDGLLESSRFLRTLLPQRHEPYVIVPSLREDGRQTARCHADL